MSARDNDIRTILVIDVESTCWEGSPPPGEFSEIIEIGVTEIDLHFLDILGNPSNHPALGNSRSILVQPVHSKVGQFCTDLTGHTQESLLRTGVDISVAFDCFEKECNSKNRIWASWGAYDRNMIEETARQLGRKPPVSRQHLNIKTMFTIARRLDKEVGMGPALEMLRWPLEGRHHSGVDDSRNIARILISLLRGLRMMSA